CIAARQHIARPLRDPQQAPAAHPARLAYNRCCTERRHNMTTTTFNLPTAEEMTERLRTWAERYRVPGATIAWMHGDEVQSAAAGVINIETGVETTPDTLFQIGSITKVYTTTLIMQLVDEGRI